MMVLREMRRRGKALIGPLLGLALIGYFAYNLVEGDRGLLAWLRVTQELRSAQKTLAGVTAEREALDRSTSHMRSERVDPDLLDTQVRKTLDVARPDEIVIMQPSEKH